MISAGRCFCPNCFSEFDADSVYFMQKINVVKENATITESIPFVVGVQRKNGKEAVILKRPVSGYQVSDEKQIKRHRSTLTSSAISGVDVTLVRESDQKRIQFVSDDTNRICPECFDQHDGVISLLPPNIGFYDSYLISMIGLRNVGKTVFAKSISTMKQKLGIVFNDTVSGSHSDTWYVSSATNKEKQLVGCYFQFQKNKKNVYVMDTAGETYTYTQSDGSTMNNAFQVKLNDYLSRYSDSMFLFLDERDMTDPYVRVNRIFSVSNQSGTKTDRDQKIINITGNVINRNKGRHNPLTCILTKGDLFHKYIQEQSGAVLKDREGKPYITKNSPLFSSIELDKGYSVEKKEGKQKLAVTLAEHMAGAYDFLMTAFDPQVGLANDTPCFVISSGSQDEENRMNFSDSCNVLFPLIHFLYKRL